MADLSITITGLSSLDEFTKFLDKVPVAASRAINRAANKTRADSSRRIREQVNFGARYLSGKDGKIELVPATRNRLEAKLGASSDARSLARFVTSASKRQGVRVTVTPGQRTALPGAFLLGVGEQTLLAVRSPTKPRTAYKPRRISGSLWSLYGPSISQTLISANNRTGIWPAMEAEIVAVLEAEFLRQIDLGVPNGGD